ncbi:MAG: dihydrolipoyl dehydrogenase [Bacteroidetes bacterium]|nr:MAG: dihydrolipoyl dehydrogenase [Bacteroidota bacterium]TAG88757.1 MAG: dihydrolipoyl dehydrogenase [Bacteroidota bacterium]
MNFDVIVIGSGPGGYVAAIRTAQLGLKTAIIEKYDTMGGTCLNVGCIPSKALLDSSEHYHNLTHTFKTHGINIGNSEVDFGQMVKRKDEVVKQTCDGVSFLMKKNKIETFTGMGSFKDKNTIIVTAKDGSKQELTTKNTIIATGSKPTPLPNVTIDKNRIITSTEGLKLPEIPKTMIVIGAGVIASELGSVYARLGTKVTMIEYLDSLIPTMDKTMGKELQKSLKKIGMEFAFSHQVTAVTSDGKSVEVKATDRKTNEEKTFSAEYCLVAIGRKAYTDKLGLENIGIELGKGGKIPVDAHLQTKVQGIYAIGDVIDGAMLAHKAEEEGVFVAETIVGQKPHIHYHLIPGVVYTWPEVASVGYTEEQLKEKAVAYKVGSFPFRALGRARASMDVDGLVKVIADEKTDEILGVHIIGARAADMIAAAVTAMEFRASAEDVARMSHAHPTYMEAFKEACLAATANRALHI